MSSFNSNNGVSTARIGGLVLLLLVLLSSLAVASAQSDYQLGVIGEERVGAMRMIELAVNSDADFDYKIHDWSRPVGCPIVAVKHMGDLDAKNGRVSRRGWAESRTQTGQPGVQSSRGD